MTVFLASATPENIRVSLDREVTEKDLAVLGDTVLQRLRAQSTPRGLHCWAMTEGSRGVFEKMRPLDHVLVCASGTGLFTHYGQVVDTVESESLGKSLWPFMHDRSWALIYFLRDVQHISWSKRELLVKLG